MNELQNPKGADHPVSPAQLAQMAQDNPEARPWIINHPACYPELRNWLLEVEPSLASYVHTAPAVPAASNYPPPPLPPADTANAAPPSGPKKRHRRLITAIATIVTIAMVAGGAYYFLIGRKLGGSATPTAAAEKLIEGVTHGDALALVGALAPSEIDGLKDIFTDVSSQSDGEGKGSSSTPTLDVEQTLKDLNTSITVATSDLRFEEQVIANDEVVRVVITGGTFTLSVDEPRLVDAVVSFQEQSIREHYDFDRDAGYWDAYSDEEFKAMVNEEVAEYQQQIQSNISGWVADINHQSFDISNQVQEEWDQLPERASVIAVKEQGNWYISPLMSAADQAYISDSSQYNSALLDTALGHSVIESQGAESPEEAASDFTEALAVGEPRSIAAMVSLPERRLLSIYAPYWMITRDAQTVWTTYDPNSWLDNYTVQLESTEFTSEKNDQGALVKPVDLSFSVTGVWTDLTFVDVDQNCIHADSVDGDDHNFCIDNPTEESWPYTKLGLTFDVVSLEEGAGWVISPLETLYLQGGRMADNYIQFFNAGRLDELLPPTNY